MKNWQILRSDYDHDKGKYSFHAILIGFHFAGIYSVQEVMVAADLSDPDVDASIYKTGVMRLPLCCKDGQNRPLVPFQLDDSLMAAHTDELDRWLSYKFTHVTEDSKILEVPNTIKALKVSYVCMLSTISDFI